MTTRPSIAPALAATLTAQLPARLVKKLDADPELAARWTWSGSTVTTDKGETVTLTVAEGVVTAVACSCLLAPSCLHVAAVVAVLAPADAASSPGLPAPEPTTATTSPVASPAVVELAATAPQVAAQALRVVADVLAAGAETTGALAQAELLRSIHACRTLGLHRLATAQIRILRSVRELRADRPEFDLEVLTSDLRVALALADAVAAGEVSPAVIGSARRDYEPIGSLRLRGVLTEAVVARSGYAGVVTYLIDERGRLYSRADVAPGDAGRAAGAYDAPANLGDAVLPHRELSRAGLFVSDATASADGRLGAGAQVRAVRASEPSRWDHEVLAPRWTVPLSEQLRAITVHDAAPDAELRPAGWDLVFVDGVVLGGGPAGVGFAVTGTGGSGETVVLRLTTIHDQRVLPARDNLAVLARSPGLALRVIGRVRIGAARQLELLALAPAAGETRLALRDAWHGRANLHYDRLALPSAARAPGAARAPDEARAPAAAPVEELLAPLRRRLERVVHGGLATLPTHAIAELEREARGLAERALHGGAELLRDLAAIAHDAGRAMAGTRRAIDRTSFARAWLRAALYEDAARRRLSVASW